MDSRITVAKQKMRAAVDLVAEAGGLIDELLEEDPAFRIEITDALKRANEHAYVCANQALLSHGALRSADRAENKVA